MFGSLVFRGFACLVIAMFAGIYWSMYDAARDHRAREASGCRHEPGVMRVAVKRVDVRYAHRSGWPRVLVKDGDAREDLLDYDHGRNAARIRGAVDPLCKDQRYRLVTRR